MTKHTPATGVTKRARPHCTVHGHSGSRPESQERAGQQLCWALELVDPAGTPARLGPTWEGRSERGRVQQAPGAGSHGVPGPPLSGDCRQGGGLGVRWRVGVRGLGSARGARAPSPRDPAPPLEPAHVSSVWGLGRNP